jgi:hypothetical protein
MLFCRAALPLPDPGPHLRVRRPTRHRAATGSPWRKLNAGRQALLVLACPRKGETFTAAAAGFEAGTTTAWRYVNQTVAPLAARAAKLRQAPAHPWSPWSATPSQRAAWPATGTR